MSAKFVRYICLVLISTCAAFYVTKICADILGFQNAVTGIVQSQNKEENRPHQSQLSFPKGIQELEKHFDYKTLIIDETDTAADAQAKYYSLVTHLDVTCKDWIRAGKQTDGGWNVCIEGPYRPKYPCLVYSFGIANDFSFDDAMGNGYNCTVRSFDPSTPYHAPNRPSGVQFYPIGLHETNGMLNHWTMKTLKTFLEHFNESDKIIDVLKMDIECSEWGSLRTILKDNTLRQVKQLILETHVEFRKTGKQGTGKMRDEMKRKEEKDMVKHYIEYANVLHGIRNQGFALWTTHANNFSTYTSPFTGEKVNACYEIGFINKNYMNE